MTNPKMKKYFKKLKAPSFLRVKLASCLPVEIAFVEHQNQCKIMSLWKAKPWVAKIWPRDARSLRNTGILHKYD